MHKEQQARDFVFEKIKVDDIKGNYLIEYKKTSSNLKGSIFQVLWYLKYFHEKGLPLKALIKDITYNQQYVLEFNEETKKKLSQILEEIKDVLAKDIPPRLTKRVLCKNCSFFDYCWVD